MPTITDPGHAGQVTDPPDATERRYSALRLTADEAARLRIATRKVARAVGGFVALSVKMGVPPSTVYHAARVGGRSSAAFAVRLATVAGVPVEMILTGKLAVQPPVIGVAA